jgi:hypothetical protein
LRGEHLIPHILQPLLRLVPLGIVACGRNGFGLGLLLNHSNGGWASVFSTIASEMAASSAASGAPTGEFFLKMFMSIGSKTRDGVESAAAEDARACGTQLLGRASHLDSPCDCAPLD